MTRPTIAEMREVCQPRSVVGRRNGEHWVGRLWGRAVSIHLTRLLAPTRVTPNFVTGAMVLVGLFASACLLVPGLPGAIGAVLCIQAYLVADCVDGELARWRSMTSMRGAYLDRIGHYVTEAALFATYGFHLERTWASGWVTLSLATSVLVLVTKAETDLVLAVGGTGGDTATTNQMEPRVGLLRRVRRVLHPLGIHRVTGAAEATLLMAAASFSVSLGWKSAGHTLILFCFLVSLLLAVGHLLSITTSRRLNAPDSLSD